MLKYLYAVDVSRTNELWILAGAWLKENLVLTEF